MPFLRFLCACGVALTLGTSAPLAVLSADTPSAGAPTPGTSTTGAPTVDASSTGTPTAGAPTPGSPIAGAPTPGTPTSDAPSSGTPTPFNMSPANPTADAPSPGATTSNTPTPFNMMPVTPAAEAPTANNSTMANEPPVLRSTINETEYKHPQTPTVNASDVREVAPGTTLEMFLSTEIASDETAKGDEFFGKISKDVLVDGQIVIPKGTQVHGVLSDLEGPKRAGRDGYINARFDYLVMPDGRKVQIDGNSTTRDSKGKAAAKVVGRAAGYTAVGGVVGTVIVLQIGGLAAAAASHGTALAGGAAIGGATGLTVAMLKKGKSVMLPPGSEMHVKLSEPLKLPTMTMPEETAEDFSISGLDVKIAVNAHNRHLGGQTSEIALTLDISNQTDYTFSTFEIGLEDDQGKVFFPTPLGDSDIWSSKIKPGTNVTTKVTFSVDNAKDRHKLVFFKPYSREPLAQYAITDAMVAHGKANPRGKSVGTMARQPN